MKPTYAIKFSVYGRYSGRIERHDIAISEGLSFAEASLEMEDLAKSIGNSRELAVTDNFSQYYEWPTCGDRPHMVGKYTLSGLTAFQAWIEPEGA